MKFTMKRMLSALLAVVMVLTMVPATAVTTDAAAVSGLSDADIGLDFTEADNGGIVSWSAAGSNITGTVSGVLSGPYYKAEQSTLTITNKKAAAAKLTFNYTVTVAEGSVTINGQAAQSNGTYEAELAGGASITITLSVAQALKSKGQNKAEIQITGISMTSDANATTTFLPGEGGSYTVTDAAGTVKQITAATQMTQHSSKTYTLAATAAEGYIFYGWYNETTKKYFAYTATTTFQTDSDCTVKPVFVSENSAIFEVGGMKFTNLTEAGDYAKEKGIETVVLTKSGMLTGNHTVPAGVTLLIPFDEKHTVYTDVPGMTGVTMNAEGSKVIETFPWVQPYAYATLTLAAGAKITVDGAISVGGEHYASGSSQSDVSHCGSPSGPVGFIKLEDASEIVINDQAALYAWGYVIGTGTVTAKSGATVRENIQFTDYRGGSATMAMAATHVKYGVFPMSQYYVQNVEAKLVLEYGATEFVHTALYVPSAALAMSAGIEFVGAKGMFRAGEGGSIVKEYLPQKDRLQIDVNGGGVITSLGIEFGGMSANTASFVLPITNNITINVLSGVATINQDMALLPGAEVTVAKGAELVLSKIDRTVTLNGEDVVVPGCNLYIYDADEWQSNGVLDPDTNEFFADIVAYFVYANRKIAPLEYSPSRTYNRTDADLKDAVLDINGTFTINGYVYTTAGGSNICSSEGTGVISMVTGLAKEYEQAKKNGQEFNTWQAVQSDKPYFAKIVVTSLKLRNLNGSYTETEETVAGDKYIWNAECGMWMKNYTGGHQGTRVGYVAPSCDEGGYIAYSCKLCGQTYKKYDGTAPTGHKAGKPVVENKTDATCTKDGGYDTVVYCTVCGDELSKEHSTIPATGHTKGQAVEENRTAATCTADGGYDTVVYCTVCGGEISREHSVIPATGHTPGEEVVENKTDATCTADGGYDTVVYCTVCGGEISRKHSVIPATGHTPGEMVIEPGKDDTHYFEVVYCTVCKGEISRVRKNAEGYAILGDVNGDEEISVLDAMLVAQYIVGDIDETGMNASVADVNGDEEISVLDAMLIAQFIVGDIEEFPVN